MLGLQTEENDEGELGELTQMESRTGFVEAARYQGERS